jgi:hypothetical protein
MDRLQAAGEVVSGEPKQSRGFRVIPPFPKENFVYKTSVKRGFVHGTPSLSI